METAGDVIDYVAQIIRRTLDKDARDYLWKRLNILYSRDAKRQSWELMRTQIDISTGTDEDGVWLPSDVAGIDRVIRRSKTDGDVEFLERSRADVAESERTYRFTRYKPASVIAFSAGDVVLPTDSNSFTSTLMSAETEDYTGEYVRFGDEKGFYLLDSNTTFTPKYTGPSFNRTSIEVRPDCTQKIICLDPDEEYVSGETVTVYYWRMPPPLYERDQLILLPSAKALQLELIIDAQAWLRQERRADRYRTELKNEAWPELVAMNPPRSIPFFPKDVVNNTFTMTEEYFKDRHND